MQKSGLNCYESFRLILSCYSAVDRGFIVQVEIYIRYWMTFLSGIIYDLKNILFTFKTFKSYVIPDIYITLEKLINM